MGPASEAESFSEFRSLVLEQVGLCEPGYGFPLSSLHHTWQDGMHVCHRLLAERCSQISHASHLHLEGPRPRCSECLPSGAGCYR